ALVGIDGVVTDEAGEKGILDRRRREIAVVSCVNHRIGFANVIRKADSGTYLNASIDQIKVVVTQTGIHGHVAKRREVILSVKAGLAAFDSAAEWREHIRIASSVEEKAFQFA